MIELGSEVAPERSAVPRRPPGGQRQAEHVERADNGGWPHPKPQQQANSDDEFDEADDIGEEHRMRKNDDFQESFVEVDGLGLDEAGNILLESAVRERGREQLVMSEEDEKNCGENSDDRDGFL